jgi:hypothetical protein
MLTTTSEPGKAVPTSVEHHCDLRDERLLERGLVRPMSVQSKYVYFNKLYHGTLEHLHVTLMSPNSSTNHGSGLQWKDNQGYELSSSSAKRLLGRSCGYCRCTKAPQTGRTIDKCSGVRWLRANASAANDAWRNTQVGSPPCTQTTFARSVSQSAHSVTRSLRHLVTVIPAYPLTHSLRHPNTAPTHLLGVAAVATAFLG